jgi:hypothetical protein
MLQRIRNRLGGFTYFSSGSRINQRTGAQEFEDIDKHIHPQDMLSGMTGCNLGLPNLQIQKIITQLENTEGDPDEEEENADEEKPTNSSSDTIICKGVLKNVRVIVKISFLSKGTTDNSLEVEGRIYDEVVPILSQFTPNLMPFIGKLSCDTFEDTVSQSSNSFLEEIWKLVIDKKLQDSYDINHATLLITKEAGGIPLEDWFKKKKVSTEEHDKFMNDVLLQIAYTLLVFKDSGLMHNDLHAGNIFVEKLEKPILLSFNIDKETQIVRQIDYFVQIYDFDWSAKIKTSTNNLTISNTLLDRMCPVYGTCNHFHENLDWFTILRTLVLLSKTSKQNEFIYRLFKDKDLVNGTFKNRPLTHPTRPCYFPKKSSRKCKQIVLDNDVLLSPLDFLKQEGRYVLSPASNDAEFSRPSKNKLIRTGWW